MVTFINLVQGSMTVREFVDKFEDLYKYTRDIYPTEEKEIQKVLRLIIEN